MRRCSGGGMHMGCAPLSSVGGGSSETTKEVKKLRAALQKLQQENQSQLRLEMESQHTFEAFHQQLTALRRAFSTLSDVFGEEMDAVKRDVHVSATILEDQATQLTRAVNSVRSDVGQYKAQQVAIQTDLLDRIEQLGKLMDDVKGRQVSGRDLMEQRLAKVEAMVNVCSSKINAAENFQQPLLNDEVVGRMNKEVGLLKKSVEALQLDHANASAALAQDVSVLAQEQNQMKRNFTQALEELAVAQRARTVAPRISGGDNTMLALQQMKDVVQTVVQRVDSLATALQSQQEMSEQRFLILEKQNNRTNISIEDLAKEIELDRERSRASAKQLEAAVRSNQQASETYLTDLERSLRRKFETVRSAMDVLFRTAHVENPIVNL